MTYGLQTSIATLRIAPVVLLTLAYAGAAHAQAAAPILTIPCPSGITTDTFSVQTGTSAAAKPTPYLQTSGVSPVTWSAPTPSNTGACTGSGLVWTCAGMTVTLPPASSDETARAEITGTGSSSQQSGTLNIRAADVTDDTLNCTQVFTFRTTADGGGWGDPHLTTVDGVHYDFQSAGEFTALREPGLEIQARQSPVPTATVPITNEYTGITHCVSIYTAVAAKLGSSRVTLQPSPGAEPDPKGMQLRVNGKVVTLGDAPYVLRSGGEQKGAIDGTITKHPDGMFEITDVHGTQLVVTSQYWSSQKVWYLNVNVYGTSAHEGTLGSIAAGSWLPALADGSALGAKPASEADRYQALYEKFADAWRVTDATSLFDYEPGTTTATFTRDEWPRNHPESCAIEGQPSVQAATDQVAQQACANVVGATRKADCVFDVMVTGHAGFGKGYEIAQRFSPLPPGWYSPVRVDVPPTTPCPVCKEIPPVPAQPWWCCWVAIVLGVLLLALLAILVKRSAKKP